MKEVLAGYTEASDTDLINRYEALDPALIYAPVRQFLPTVPCRLLDIGAGTGRDAAWFASRGHQVVAAEPVEPLREAGRARRRLPGLTFADDRLPRLEKAARLGPYAFVTCCAVWQHVEDPERALAVRSIGGLLGGGGLLIVSLRHGPGGIGRPVFAIDPARTIADAASSGLALRHRVEAPSVQQRNRDLGVSWTWLVLEKPQ